MTVSKYLQQSGAHAFSRTLHAQLLHDGRKQHALNTSSGLDITQLDDSFGGFKQGQNRSDNSIAGDRHFLLVEVQLHSALAKNRLPLWSVPRSSTDTKFIKRTSAPLKHRWHHDVRANPLLGVVVPEATHEHTKMTATSIKLAKLHTLATRALTSSACHSLQLEATTLFAPPAPCSSKALPKTGGTSRGR